MTQEARELRDKYIVPALQTLGLDQGRQLDVATNLVLGTAVHESGGLHYRRQIGGGPALGLWQIEPSTFTDIYDNFLKSRPVLEGKVESLLPHGESQIDRLAQLVTNDAYGAALCRIKYFRSSLKLPVEPNDVFEMGRLWAAAYNTRWPAQRFIDDYRRYVEDVPESQISSPATGV